MAIAELLMTCAFFRVFDLFRIGENDVILQRDHDNS